jgi:predicted DsbA family dithiol-disulfide isomerase
MLRPEDQSNPTFTPYYLQHRAAARRLTGLPFDLPPVGTPYPRSSRWALEAAKWVERQYPRAFEAFDLALFEAFFGETRDISDIAVLAELAQRQGLPGAELSEALRAHAFADAVWADYREALEAGLTGIPTVLIGGQAISGAVAYEEYERAARGLLPGRRLPLIG